MAEIPNVRLSLSNRPENVLVVRQALTGVAGSLGLDAIETNDLNTAVTEACNNVVLHAYAGGEGPLEVDVYALADGLTVTVRDHGSGIGLRPRERDHDDVHGGIGVPVINALSRRAEFKDLDGVGTEVRMEFAASNATALERLDGNGRAPGDGVRAQLTSTVELSVAPTALARAVLPRILSALAARAHFSTDRIADVQLVADVLAASAYDSISGSHLDVGVTMAPRNLQLRIGPLRAGCGENLAAAADGLAPVIERLTDAKRVAHADFGETLELTLVDRR
jgi:serine/threonine-protein kinase RsbW